MEPIVIAGQPSFRVASDLVEAWLTELGGHLGPVVFRLGERNVSPLHVAPWAEEPSARELPPVLRALRGDFFCMPFGANESEYEEERHPLHGETANGVWRLVASSPGSARLILETKVRPGRVTKQISLRPGQTAVYSRHEIEGMAGPMTIGHHAMLRFPATEGAGRVALGPFGFGQVFPGEFESPASGGYTSLLPGARFDRLDRVPQASGGFADLSRYPARRGFEDLVMVYSRPGERLGWTSASFPNEGFLWYSLKDPRVLTGTILWHSNGGRHYAPWNGRHVGVLGLEEVTASMHRGLAESLAENEASREGYRTYVELDPALPLAVNTIMGVVSIPPAFDRVAKVEEAPGGVSFLAESGASAHAEVELAFLYE